MQRPPLLTPLPHGRAESGVEVIQPGQYTDRRTEARENCNALGALVLVATHEVVDCRILDQSPSGARVAFDQMSHLPAEIWLIDSVNPMARRGSAAWSTPNRMGLKFNFVLPLKPGQPRPEKVPQDVYDTWLKLTGQTPPPLADDAIYFD